MKLRDYIDISIFIMIIILLVLIYFRVETNTVNYNFYIRDYTIDDFEVKETPEEPDLQTKKQIVRELLKESHLNDKERSELFKYILKYSSKYETDPFLVYAILWKESRLRNDVVHKRVYIKSLDKQVQAEGAGAIIWDFWHTKLKTNTTIKNKSELENLEKNIEATAYIISYLSKKPLRNKTNTTLENVCARYFGAVNKSYIQQVKTKYNNLKASI